MVVPSCPVTIMVIAFWPTLRGIDCDAVPDVTVVPFTFTVAVASIVVGVTVTDAMA